MCLQWRNASLKLKKFSKISTDNPAKKTSAKVVQKLKQQEKQCVKENQFKRKKQAVENKKKKLKVIERL